MSKRIYDAVIPCGQFTDKNGITKTKIKFLSWCFYQGRALQYEFLDDVIIRVTQRLKGTFLPFQAKHSEPRNLRSLSLYNRRQYV